MSNNDNVALTYEASIRYLVEQSNKRAWLVAFLAVIISAIAVTAVCLLTPLKSVEPYVIRVDNTTGMVDIITSVNEETLTGNEALDKYFAGLYVKTREGYYFNMLQNDYTLTQILSAPNIAADYVAIYQGENPRQEILKNKVEVSVDIVSITLSNSAGSSVATIRFNLVSKNLEHGNKTTQAKIVTMAYEYNPALLTKEEERLKNPLGFKVITYRIDDEIRR
ncbi:type IV secretion system protein [Campylobacter sp.]|uniref:virB8 family protein n=1 Tax=Campylobacter sp. TaxID=205 RepID=UPI002A75B1B8|nr:type IV secretion system protein [Campylobacter sp.]MDY3246354.1 type IV secretion system protein [Campylobacter sp.]MDY4803771.1 type IV secretion system protein [Campylobacter sp.]